ncbi:unnamed protein product [Arctogadus glacialis]
MTQDDDVDAGRECAPKWLCVYLNEDPANLVREFLAEDEAAIKESIGDTTVGIFVVKNDATSGPEDVGIVLEGLQTMQGLDNAALAAAILFRLMYVLNLNYPPELKYTFEVCQKVVMELDGTTLSKKAQVLKNRL